MPGSGARRLRRGLVGGGRSDREIGGGGSARHISIAAAIDRDTNRIIHTASAEVGDVNQSVRALRGINLGHVNVLRAVERGLVYAGDGRKIGGCGRSGQVDVAGAVDGDLAEMLIAGATEVGRVGQDGIDNQFAGMIVRANGESGAVAGVQHEAAFDRLLAAIDLLIDAGCVEANGATLSFDYQRPGAQLKAVGAIEFELGLGRVGPRCDLEIVFQPALVAVKR